MSSNLAILVALQAALALTTIAQGSSSQLMDARQVVARTNAEWQALWREHSPAPAPAVDIDFGESMVIGVFLGLRRTAGYSVTITSATRRGNSIVVEYVEREPDGGQATAQVLTSPFHLAVIPRTTNAVEFRKVESAPQPTRP
jgi:hypothetical protein